MNANQINVYLERAREIIGDRSQAEIDYDDAVVAHLSSGTYIEKAVAAANQKYPDEALKPDASHWADMQARYVYLRDHKGILKKLGISE